MVCLHFHSLNWVLCPCQVLRKIEAGIDVAPSNVDDLPVERHNAPTSRITGSLPALQDGLPVPLTRTR